MQVLTSKGNGDEGNRTTLDSASKTPISSKVTKNGTQDGTPKGDFDPDLRQIISAWHDLPDRVKQQIMSMVEPYTKTPDPDRRRADVLDALSRAHSDDRQGDRMHEGERP